jgi:hypothetical protein
MPTNAIMGESHGGEPHRRRLACGRVGDGRGCGGRPEAAADVGDAGHDDDHRAGLLIGGKHDPLERIGLQEEVPPGIE